MEKLCGKSLETPYEGVTFFRRICDLFRHRVKEKIDSPKNTETSGEDNETNLDEETVVPQIDKQSVETKLKLTAKEKHERRAERRAERRRETERAKSAQITAKNGVRLLPDETDIVKEMTGETNLGPVPSIDEAILEKETDTSANPDYKVSEKEIKIKLKNLSQEDMLKIDFHGDTRNDGIDQKIDNLILDGKNSNEKFVLIITGWGKNSRNGEAVLKPVVQSLLEERRKKGEIKYFMEAPKRLGKKGAFVVVLR